MWGLPQAGGAHQRLSKATPCLAASPGPARPRSSLQHGRRLAEGGRPDRWRRSPQQGEPPSRRGMQLRVAAPQSNPGVPRPIPRGTFIPPGEGGVPPGGGGAGGRGGPRGKGLSGEGEGEEGDSSESELLNLQQAEEMAAARGVTLPGDLAALAASEGLRRACLQSFLALQGFGAWLARLTPIVRDRLIQDPRYLFKVLAEVGIDAGCATVAEVQKRGADFWAEFDFYLSDLVVGCVLDVVLVTLMAPPAVLGPKPRAAPTGLRAALGRIPSACCEGSTPQRRYRLADRVACLFVKFAEYSLAGMVCGYAGQGLANSLVLLKRRMLGSSEGEVAMPPVGRTALVWGLFMGVSSNVRYQAVFGLERLVEVSVGQRVPAAAYASTLLLRFANNVVGGMQFVDLARWAGIQ